jgi:hypothetical protein
MEDRLDRLVRRYHRARSWVLCHFGLHMWATRHSPGVSGRDAVYEDCRRCGHERMSYDFRSLT